MHAFLRHFGLWTLLGFLAAGCSTPGKRARQHAEAFHRLSQSDQALVLQGRVRPGLSQEGVYIAWGKPDEKTSECAYKDAPDNETWIYRQRVTVSEPINSYDYFGPYHGYGGWPAQPWLRPGFGVGGFGNEGSLQYQPHVRNLDTLRVFVFSGAKKLLEKPQPTASSSHAKQPAHHGHRPPQKHRTHGSRSASSSRR